MPIKSEREYRAMIPLATVEEQGEKRIQSDYYVEGFATTFNDPYLLYEVDGVKIYEMVDARALEGADISDVIFQYDHQGKVLARISNGTLGIEATEKGLHVWADLSKSAAAKEMYEEIRNGLVTKMSWAFTVREDEYDKESRTRKILGIKKVFDVSAVSIPANDGTEIAARSYADGVIERERLEELVRRKRKLKLLIDMEV